MLTAHAFLGRGKGSTYLVDGVLCAAWSVGKPTLRFKSLERFLVPVAVSSDLGDEVGHAIVGEVKGWGPGSFHYLPDGPAERAVAPDASAQLVTRV